MRNILGDHYLHVDKNRFLLYLPTTLYFNKPTEFIITDSL